MVQRITSILTAGTTSGPDTQRHSTAILLAIHGVIEDIVYSALEGPRGHECYFVYDCIIVLGNTPINRVYTVSGEIIRTLSTFQHFFH